MREAFILRILAVERWVRALILAALAAAVFEFESTQTSVQAWFEREIPRLEPAARQLNINLETCTVEDEHGFGARFQIDDFTRHCLLEGLDDIGLTLQHESDISAYEAQHSVPAAWKS